MAASDIRRLETTITRLEDSARLLRNPAAITLTTDQAEAAFLADELVDARRRLRVLLAAH